MKRIGVMLDCSRNAVPNVKSVKIFIDCLAKMGYNTLELYTEDTYAVEGEPYFGYLRGRYSSEEICQLDTYAKKNGIELIPCIQTLAHFTCLYRSVYNDIIDTDDILLIDEILAVGDVNFQKKCINQIKKFKKNGVTMVFVSHNMSDVLEICDSVVWLDKGEIKECGATPEVVDRYLAEMERRGVTDE